MTSEEMRLARRRLGAKREDAIEAAIAQCRSDIKAANRLSDHRAAERKFNEAFNAAWDAYCKAVDELKGTTNVP